MLTRAMRTDARLSQAIIGSERMLNDRTAQILEVTQLQAYGNFQDLIHESVVINPREILIVPAASQAEWEDRLTELLRDDPPKAGVQLR